MSLENKPKLAVVGSGYWGKNLVRNFHALGAVRLICDRDEAVLEGLREQYPDLGVCLAYNEVLRRKDIQSVVIATPAESHFRLAREALLFGKHVFVEKPLVLDEREGLELIELAEKNQRVLMVGHLLQYHPAFRRLRDIADSGGLGRINYIYSHRLNLGKIRREENILWSFAPHDISMILSLAGEAPESILATGGNYLHRKIADVTTTHLVFPSGLRAHIFVSWLHPFKEQKLVVVGDRKMVVFDDTQPWEDKLLLCPHHVDWQNHMPVPVKGDPERVEISQAEPLQLECAHFLDCIEKGCTPVTDGDEGLGVLRVLKASQVSLDHKGAAVSLKGLISRKGKKPGFSDVFIHATAVVDEGAQIGSGTRIWHFSHILTGSKIGNNCNLGQNVVIGPDVRVGTGCKIQNNVSVYKGVTLEDGVFCGPSMVFTNVFTPRAEIRKMDQVRPTLVERGATIGANATIVCGTRIGAYAFVGAAALVNRNVPDHAMVVGNPARQIGWVCRCGERLTDDLECLGCEERYHQADDGSIRVRRGKKERVGLPDRQGETGRKNRRGA